MKFEKIKSLLKRQNTNEKKFENKQETITDSIVKNEPEKVKNEPVKSEVDYITHNYKVAGISFHNEELMGLAEENICYDYTKKEILDDLMYNERIYQYDFYPDKIELVPEPTNEYDPNAVKVIVDNIHIGYIKKGNCKHILNLINEKRIKSITCDIYGGKYKILEYEGEDDIDFVDNPKLKDFTLYKDEAEYGAKVTIKELKRVGQ